MCANHRIYFEKNIYEKKLCCFFTDSFNELSMMTVTILNPMSECIELECNLLLCFQFFEVVFALVTCIIELINNVYF